MGCCQSLTGMPRDCDTNVGGIRKAWIACEDSVNSVTVTDGVIQAISAETGAFHEYEFRKQTGSVTTTFTKDDAAGSFYYESAIVFQFSRMEIEKRLEISQLAVSDLVMIILDNNGKYWYFGYDEYVSLTDGTAQTGQAFADLNGYNLTFTDFSQDLPYPVDPKVIATITGNAA